MKIHTAENPFRIVTTQLSVSVSLSHFPSLTRKNRNFLLSRRKWLLRSTSVALRLSYFRASCAPSSTSCGGWEDLSTVAEPDVPGGSDVLRSLLVSVGIDDRKHVFVFLLGFVCALAISRGKVSSIVVFPASVLVFAIGFTLGLFRTGTATGKKRRAKEENFKFHTEKLKNLFEVFDGIDLEINELKDNIKNAIDNNEIRLGDLKNYIKVTDSLSLSAVNARNVVKNLIDTEGISNVIANDNHKTSKKEEVREAGYDLLQPIEGFFTENSVGSGAGKGKENVKQDKLEDAFDHSATTSPNLSKEYSHTVKNYMTNEDGNAGRGSLGNLAFNNSKAARTDSPLDNELPSLQNNGNRSRKYGDRKEYGTRNDRTWSRNNHNSGMVSTKEMGMWDSLDDLLHSKNYDVTVKQSKTASSFVQEHVLKESSETFWSSHEKQRQNNFSGSDNQEVRRNIENESCLSDNLSSGSAKLSEDVAFDKYIAEATDLLKQAKECVKGRYDEELAEIMLYRSSKLFSKAVAMKPVSLLAVGQLGNTYLLHGELKLKISRELRALLSGSIPTSVLQQDGILKGLYSKFANKDEVASFLIDVCEECEELLVEAGRKYRLALSIDANDVRALYNWGLALSFRGQLIADIGPEAAFDADKVFLAAIDKFDAIMSRGNVYASDALYRWGAALQERSRLRPRRSKEKVKLLEQAKRLYEDALDMDSDNFQVRKALSSCISELDYRQY